jgi:hypothetical protein
MLWDWVGRIGALLVVFGVYNLIGWDGVMIILGVVMTATALRQIEKDSEKRNT